jgi:predicted DNA-binding transcriptional regulator YafY
MCARRAIRINYLSLTSGGKRREIVPVALADNGLRWHVRAFDRERLRFGDFVLTRISRVEELKGESTHNESLIADEQWARVVEMELVPHPGLKHPRAIEADYSMRNGVLRVKSRAAMAGYLLRRWSVDASPDHHLNPATYHLWLRNTPTLYGVESAAIAPGICLPDMEAMPGGE